MMVHKVECTHLQKHGGVQARNVGESAGGWSCSCVEKGAPDKKSNEDVMMQGRSVCRIRVLFFFSAKFADGGIRDLFATQINENDRREMGL